MLFIHLTLVNPRDQVMVAQAVSGFLCGVTPTSLFWEDSEHTDRPVHVNQARQLVYFFKVMPPTGLPYSPS